MATKTIAWTIWIAIGLAVSGGIMAFSFMIANKVTLEFGTPSFDYDQAVRGERLVDVKFSVKNRGVLSVWYRDALPDHTALGCTKKIDGSTERLSEHKFAPWKELRPGESIVVKEFSVNRDSDLVGIQLKTWLGFRKNVFTQIQKIPVP